ncbi:alpha/beta-hydrolase [Coniochaeta ligniaria NRRL 30616]|uniref:Carboxylic ester hydrolase n=1 Tax=Coniochaeta ligniaria NRRL 30616 TaxID=1408157 RepID=A0A1J7JAF8_9PEZI|nr:alpha/beta-hydrolase [Coniochaeta ligniaria NRRL 30616]
MGLIRVLTAAVVAVGLAQEVLAGSFTLPEWPQPPGGSHPRCRTASTLTVDVGYAVYQGVQNRSSKLNVWKGIRYAAPPVGDLRWKEAIEPATNRTATLADTFGSTCPGVLPPGAPFFPGDSEDCLFLNVWAPENAKNLPVLVWIHGGGYGYGDGTQDMTEFINDNGNSFLVVSIQYRLGAFGFLSSDEVKSTGVVNAGILDQAFALSWVQSYISFFGGDPSRVTISGESAGGGSVMYHAMAGRGTLGTLLFKGAIASSPYLVPQYTYNDTVPTRRYYNFASAAGCPSSGEVLSCLRSKNTSTLQAANYQVGQLAASGMWYFLPVTDGAYIASLPSNQLLSSNPVNGLRLLVGNNAHEGDLFVPTNIATESDLLTWLAIEFATLPRASLLSILAQYPLSVSLTHQERANNIYAEAQFVCPSYWLADAFTSPPNSTTPNMRSRKAWHYQYSVPYASHGTDISAIFGPAGANQAAGVVQALRKAWGRFVTDDDPGVGFPVWKVGAGAEQVDFNQTGGTAVEVTSSWGVNVTEYRGPGLRADIKAVDAYAWEGGRGARCQFWRTLGAEILQ